MENLKEYFNTHNRWLPCIGKAPRRIAAPSTDWNVVGNQYSAREVFTYKKDNPAMGWGTVIFKNDPIIIIDIDKLTDAGESYLELHNSLPLMQTEASTILSQIDVVDVLAERSISGRGIHIYLLLTSPVTTVPSIVRYNNTMGGLCDHIEIFNGGSNEDDSKGKFVVFTGNVIKDFSVDFTPVETITPSTTESKSTLIYTDVENLPTYTRKTTDEKLLNKLLENKQFELLYTKGIVVKETDINTDTLTAIKEEEMDTSKKVYRLVSILVKYCQHFKTIDKLFRGSFFYKHTHWGLEHKWERLIATHNNSNPILSAYNTKVSAARASGKPDYTFFKTPYTTEVCNQIRHEEISKRREEKAEQKALIEAEKEAEREAKREAREEKKAVIEAEREAKREAKEAAREEKERIKEEKKQRKQLEKYVIIEKFQKQIAAIKEENKELYTEYKKIDETFELFDELDIDEDTIIDERILCKMYWKLFPYTLKIDDGVRGGWAVYNKDKHYYEMMSNEELQVNIINFFIDLFPNRNHTFREKLARSTVTYYKVLNKPYINIYKTNSFIHLNNDKGYYYKVKNGILDVLNSKLLNNTPNFLAFNELPFEIDSKFMVALSTGEYKGYIEGTLFYKFLTLSFPTNFIKEEIAKLINNPKLVSEEYNKYIFKRTDVTSNYRFSHQIKVLQRMLGYTILPRHVLNSDKAMILYGVAGSGKSTLAKLLGYLLTGRKNLSGLTTSFLALEKNQYALAPFKTAPIIVVNELPDKFSADIRGTLNALISGESVDINEKFRPNVSMQLPAKIVLIGNVLPKIIDNSGSLSRRSVIVNFAVNVSKTKNAIENIDDKLIEPENLKAFFLFCLSGAKEVLTNNTVVVSKVGLDLLIKMEQQNNPIEDVLKETIEFISDSELKKEFQTKDLAIPKTEVIQHIKNYIASSYNNTIVTLKSLQSGSNIANMISETVAKHFNVPVYDINCKIILGRNNPYKKHSNLVEVIRGIRLKTFVPELTKEDLETLQLGGE
jgi:flagellar biosynthesis GTPase FlhF